MKPDRTSGATTVADKFVNHLHERLTKSKNRSHKAVIAGLEKECLKFLVDYPAMGNIHSLINVIGLEMDCPEKKGLDKSEYVEAVYSQIERWKEDEFEALQVIPKLAAKAIGRSKSILAVSSSELVKQTFLVLKREGVRAVVLESRPLREGEKTALSLAKAGIPTTLIVDVAFPSLEKEVDAVLIGADRISNTLVNKVGSRLLLEWATETKKPVFVVCQTSKFVPPAWCVLPLPSAPSDEVSRLKHPKLEVRNFYFEECPLDLAGAVITEEGVLDPEAIRKKIAALETSNWFRFLLQKLYA